MSTKNNCVFLKSLSLGGYKSFGELQTFVKFSKITILIGQNNIGKSNLLRFIHDIYPQITSSRPITLNPLDRHLPSLPSLSYGTSIKLGGNNPNYEEFNQHIPPMFSESDKKTTRISDLLLAFSEKAKLDGLDDVWFNYDQEKKLIEKNWKESFDKIDDRGMQNIWASLTAQGSGSRSAHWYPETLQKVKLQLPLNKVVMIPAIRQIGV
jgi:predicted ATP-dependent endonuclease of OLD family